MEGVPKDISEVPCLNNFPSSLPHSPCLPHQWTRDKFYSFRTLVSLSYCPFSFCTERKMESMCESLGQGLLVVMGFAFSQRSAGFDLYIPVIGGSWDPREDSAVAEQQEGMKNKESEGQS